MNERKFQLANIVDKYVKGKMKRRDFVRNAGMLGLGAGALGLGSRYGLGGLMPKAYAVSAKSNDFDSNGNEKTIDYEKMLRIVKNFDYNGFIGVEYEGSRLSEIDGIKATRDLLIKIGQSI